MFEPFFDQYLATVVFNGGTPVYVPLHPDRSVPKPTGDDWKIDFDELRYAPATLGGYLNLDKAYSAALSSKTKMILLNTPHNPVGKVFTREELEKIAALAEEFNLMVVSDEVVCRPSIQTFHERDADSSMTTVRHSCVRQAAARSLRDASWHVGPYSDRLFRRQ